MRQNSRNLHVSQAFASYTHNTSYYLLNFVHIIVCIYGLTKQVWKIPWVLCKIVLLLNKKGEIVKIYFFFWKIGFKTCVLEEHFISYEYIFISYIQYFEVSFQKSGYFSKKLFFQNFDWSNLIFDQLKSCFKNSVSLCLVRLLELGFRSIEHRDSSFLKTVF